MHLKTLRNFNTPSKIKSMDGVLKSSTEDPILRLIRGSGVLYILSSLDRNLRS